MPCAPRTTPRAASRPAATGAAVRRCIGAQLKTPDGGDARFVRLVGRLRIRKSSPGAAAARACSHTAARALRPARIPSARRRSRRRTAGPAGRDRAEEARDATQRGHPEVIARRNRASGTRPRVAVPGKWRPPARRALSSARRRSRQRTTGGGTGRRQRAARSALCHPTRARGIYRPEQPRHGRAGCASASGAGSALCHPTGPSGRYRAAQPRRGACRLRVDARRGGRSPTFLDTAPMQDGAPSTAGKVSWMRGPSARRASNPHADRSSAFALRGPSSTP